MVSLSFLKRSSRFNWKIQAMTWVTAGYYVHGLPPSCRSLSCLRRLGSLVFGVLAVFGNWVWLFCLPLTMIR
ncbi:hypothetical protein ACOSQ3_027686 [Xanthoceras sorbifolium]